MSMGLPYRWSTSSKNVALIASVARRAAGLSTVS
jgi:hypothetical protein